MTFNGVILRRFTKFSGIGANYV